MLLTLHMEEGTCCVLPGAAPCPALIVPRVGRLDSAKTQRPTLNHSLWWQRTCRDMTCNYPCSLCPPTRSWCPPGPSGHLPSHSRVGWGLPVTTQRNSAGCPGATVSWAGSTVAVGALAVLAVVRPRGA